MREHQFIEYETLADYVKGLKAEGIWISRYLRGDLQNVTLTACNRETLHRWKGKAAQVKTALEANNIVAMEGKEWTIEEVDSLTKRS